MAHANASYIKWLCEVIKHNQPGRGQKGREPKDKCPDPRTMSSREDRTWQDKQISNRKQNIFPGINGKIGKYI